MPNIQGYGPADLARMRSIQTNPGTVRPIVRERPGPGLRMLRVIRKISDTGATIVTKEYVARGRTRRDVTVAPLPVVGFGAIPRRRA